MELKNLLAEPNTLSFAKNEAGRFCVGNKSEHDSRIRRQALGMISHDEDTSQSPAVKGE